MGRKHDNKTNTVLTAGVNENLRREKNAKITCRFHTFTARTLKGMRRRIAGGKGSLFLFGLLLCGAVGGATTASRRFFVLVLLLLRFLHLRTEFQLNRCRVKTEYYSYQSFGSLTFWHGSGSEDPYH